LSERAWSVTSRKSGGAEHSGERELQKNDGAQPSAEREVGRGAGTEGEALKYVEARSGFFCCSIQYCVYCVVFLMYGTLGHFECIGRLVFVAMHYPRACNKQVG